MIAQLSINIDELEAKWQLPLFESEGHFSTHSADEHAPTLPCPWAEWVEK
jgi:hypothetical protein